MVQKLSFPATISGRAEARTESHFRPDPCNTTGGGPLHENRVFHKGGGPAHSIRGLPAESLTQPHSWRAESTRTAAHWRCHAGGTRPPPPRSQSPTRSRPPWRKRIRKACLLPQPPEQPRHPATCCTAQSSSGLRLALAAQGRELPARRST